MKCDGFVYSMLRTAALLALITNSAGCVSSMPAPEHKNDPNESSLGYFDSNFTRIFGDCNAVVTVVNSNNNIINNSVDCSATKNKRATDAKYCMQESKREFMVLYPSGILTLPLFPIMAIGNYMNKINAEKDAEQIFVACMEARGHIMNGYGTYTFENGNKYQGNWKDGAFDGKGAFYWKKGGSYDGQWKNGLKSGDGFDSYSDGVTYKGAFENDMKNGYGVLKWPDGRRFEGSFRDNKPDGRGIFITAKGERYEGNWSNGCFKDGDRWAIVNQSEAYCR